MERSISNILGIALAVSGIGFAVMGAYGTFKVVPETKEIGSRLVGNRDGYLDNSEKQQLVDMVYNESTHKPFKKPTSLGYIALRDLIHFNNTHSKDLSDK